AWVTALFTFSHPWPLALNMGYDVTSPSSTENAILLITLPLPFDLTRNLGSTCREDELSISRSNTSYDRAIFLGYTWYLNVTPKFDGSMKAMRAAAIKPFSLHCQPTQTQRTVEPSLDLGERKQSSTSSIRSNLAYILPTVQKCPRREAQELPSHSKEFPEGYGDFVFKSSDGVIFHFPRFLLAHVSPVFKD
ncbi:92_t:CDS:2, partial [Acaulospora colombiana]